MPKPAYRPAIIMAISFLVAQFLALLIIPLYPQEYRAFGDPNDVMNPIYYLVLVLGTTAIMLFLAKKGLDRLIQYFMIASVWGTIVFVLYPVLYALLPPPVPMVGDYLDLAAILTLYIATLISGALYIRPEWYVIDIAGVVMGSGIIAVLGLSFGILPTIILLIVMAVYDFISVYRTKHMLDLADAVLETKLPIVMVAPKERNYSFVEDTIKIKKEDGGGGEREAMFMGLGDIIIPGILPASIFLNSGASHDIAFGMATFSIIGAFMGYLLLLHFVFKGKAHAGLPPLNTGAILGYMIGAFILTGNPIFGMVFGW